MSDISCSIKFESYNPTFLLLKSAVFNYFLENGAISRPKRCLLTYDKTYISFNFTYSIRHTSKLSIHKWLFLCHPIPRANPNPTYSFKRKLECQRWCFKRALCLGHRLSSSLLVWFKLKESERLSFIVIMAIQSILDPVPANSVII